MVGGIERKLEEDIVDQGADVSRAKVQFSSTQFYLIAEFIDLCFVVESGDGQD